MGESTWIGMTAMFDGTIECQFFWFDHTSYQFDHTEWNVYGDGKVKTFVGGNRHSHIAISYALALKNVAADWNVLIDQ